MSMISIITPSFNQAKYIERTIQSVLSQNIANLEYIVMDGASTDETLAILNKYSHQLRYFSEKDNGQAHAVNKGLKIASAEIIGWLNSDDVYYPNAISRVLEFFANHPEIDVVYGKAHHIDEYGQILELYPTEKWNVNRLKQICFLSQPAVFFRKNIIERFGILNENLHFCLDYEYWLRLARGGAKFAYLPEILAGSRLYPDTKTLRAPLEALREVKLMLHNELGYVPANWLITETINIIKNKKNFKISYFIHILFLSLINTFSQNGFFYGLRTSLELPKELILRIYSRIRSANSFPSC